MVFFLIFVFVSLCFFYVFVLFGVGGSLLLLNVFVVFFEFILSVGGLGEECVVVFLVLFLFMVFIVCVVVVCCSFIKLSLLYLGLE